MNATREGTLLVDGAAAFDEILRCIDAARRSLFINMFIWRDDTVGRCMANAVLRAADRGVRVTLSLDRVGMILESAEESERSLFHQSPTLAERLKINVLRLCYPKNRGKRGAPDTALLPALLSHPNVTLDKDRHKADHSKYYIIDEEILIFGGINVEDKERERDSRGLVYQDYMLKLEGEAHVRAFLQKKKENRDTAVGYAFRMNNKSLSPAVFEMREAFLSVINGATRELVIVMAYFAPLPDVMDAIVSAWQRGVRIRILIPASANFQNNSNRRTVRLLMKRCHNGIQLFLSPKMVHTKLIYNESTVMLGSSNITRLAFTHLGELDITLPNTASPLTNRLLESVEENFALSTPVTHYKEVRYSPVAALVEGLFN